MERGMPVYYFDIYDNDRFMPDDFGAELEDVQEARIQAIALLPDLARDALPDGDHHVFKVVVKCPDRLVHYMATLTLDGGWVDPPGVPEEA